MTIQEASKKWNVEERRITMLCRNGRIQGANKKNGMWDIPITANNPGDGRMLRGTTTCFYKPLPIGISDFKETVSKYYYVDKTRLIKELIDDLPKVCLFTRPRRFGKTLTMDMLRVFFEKTNYDTSIYFKDKEIWSYGEKYTSYQGKYPVISLSFKDLKCLTWDETYEKLRKIISLEFQRHEELNTSDKLSLYEKEQYNLLSTERGSVVDYQMSLQLLSMLLYKHYGKQCVICLDEYDTPIQQGFNQNFYKEIINFTRNFFSGGFKDNSFLAFGFMTGILRVAKESIFSGMNNIVDNSILQDRYSSYFGFTKDEVKTILSVYGKREKFNEVYEWYDGYHFGNSEIFNPWSVISYIKNGCKAQPYWQNTGSNEIIRQIILNSDVDTKEKLQALMEGKTVLADIDTSVIYPEIKDNPQSVLSFLVVAGYLKIDRSTGIEGTNLFYVSIPNKEILRIYGKEILFALNGNKIQSTALSVQQCILDNNTSEMQYHLQKYLEQTISFFDTSSESFYHGLILGLYAVMNDLYSITSNREAGEGRFDIQMLPYNNRLPAIIIEIKVLHIKTDVPNDITQKLLDLAKSALNQINDKGYEMQLKSKDLKVVKLGIAFYKKQVSVISD